MSEQSDALEAQQAQRAAAKSETVKRATMEAMRAKKPRQVEFSMQLAGAGEQVSFLFVSIGSKKYDDLVTKCPPTAEQMARGAAFDIDKFGPELLSRVCQEPAFTLDEWRELWNSPAYDTGEIGSLFARAQALCVTPVDLTPIVAG